ncbi:MAG TPA: hypothetical protein VFI84_04525 [Candidatus Saccharimonadales bacterium]|nr:hypothetical protein [Candidatus Saccharimonadales bacterium]
MTSESFTAGTHRQERVEPSSADMFSRDSFVDAYGAYQIANDKFEKADDEAHLAHYYTVEVSSRAVAVRALASLRLVWLRHQRNVALHRLDDAEKGLIPRQRSAQD